MLANIDDFSSERSVFKEFYTAQYMSDTINHSCKQTTLPR